MIINLAQINFAGGSGGGMSEDQEYVIALALNDLNENKEDKVGE